MSLKPSSKMQLRELIHNLNAYDDEFETKVIKLRKLGKEAIVELILATKSEEIPGELGILGESHAGTALVLLKDIAYETLIDYLKSEDEILRKNCAYIVGLIHNPLAIPQLIKGLDDISFEVQKAIIFSLGELCARKAVPLLIEKLKNSKLTIVTIKSLKRIGDHRAGQPLIELLSNNSSIVKRAAIEALGTLRENAAFDLLLCSLVDKNKNIRRTSAEALGLIQNKGAVPFLCEYILSNLKHYRVIEFIGDMKDHRATDTLITLLMEGDTPPSRYNAAQALGKIRDDKAIKPLIVALEDENEVVQKYAAGALYNYDGAQFIDIIVNALKKHPIRLKWMLIYILSKLNVRSAADLIYNIANDLSPEFKGIFIDTMIQSAEALAKFGDDRTIEICKRCLEVTENDEIILTLAKFGGVEATALLKKYSYPLHADLASRNLKKFPKYLKQKKWQINAAEALTHYCDESIIDSVIEAFNSSKNEYVRFIIAEALVKVNTKETMQALIHGFDNPSTWGRWGAAHAVQQLATVSHENISNLIELDVMNKLEKGLMDEDFNVRDCCVEILGLIGDNTSMILLRNYLENINLSQLWRYDEWYSMSIQVRENAIKSLSRIGGDEAINTIKFTLKDPSPIVRLTARKMLEKMDNK